MGPHIYRHTFRNGLGPARCPFAAFRSSAQFHNRTGPRGVQRPHANCSALSTYGSSVAQCRSSAARGLFCRSTGTDGSTSTAPRDTEERIKTTLADLDALLGIEEESSTNESKVGLHMHASHRTVAGRMAYVAWMRSSCIPHQGAGRHLIGTKYGS